jgi:trehalose 6-phosphate synthase
MAWTKERLEEVAKSLGSTRLVVVANREPYIHVYEEEEVQCKRPAGGLTTALDPVMQVCGGSWVAFGSGDADPDMADEQGRVPVPPEGPSYTLRRVWLTKEEEQGYYNGLANEALWPLCHNSFTRPLFNPSDWEYYKQVNRKFADAALQEVGPGPGLVFVQDYHFALLPRMLKQARPDLVVLQFWHIPWPHPEVFRICPWQEELLEGMLGNDLLCFHTQNHCNNFLDTVDRSLEARLDRENFAVTRGGRATFIRPYPISIDPNLMADLDNEEGRRIELSLYKKLRVQDRLMLVGVDRMDYTKGIPERIRAIDRLLTLHPELKKRFHLVQVAAPSRTHIPTYRRLNEEVHDLVEEINWKHGDFHWRPVILINETYGPAQVAALFRMATGCIVSSLHDGMNLVAKEFVAARTDEQGVLVLSKFTGAAQELTDALLINPYAMDEFAEALYRALTMPAEEQRRRMQRLRAQVAEKNIFRWAGQMLSDASRLVEIRHGSNGTAGNNGAAGIRPPVAGLSFRVPAGVVA